MKKLAIIGASYLQLPLVVKAKKMNIETHCFAWDEDAVCKDEADYFYPISIRNKEEILDICMKIGIDGVTSIASDVAVPTMNYVAEKMGLIGNSIEDSIYATNKYKMRERFSLYSIASPAYIFTKEQTVSVENMNYPLIVKPTDRSGSLGVMIVNNKNDLDKAIERAQHESFSNEAIIEEYIEGDEVSVETISWKGKHYILTITDKATTGKPHFVELEHHQPSQLSESLQLKIKKNTLVALDAINHRFGASHTEFKITDKGEVFIIETGSRMGGDFIGSHLVELSTGYDFLEAVIKLAMGEFEIPNVESQNYSGIYFLSEETKYLKDMIMNSKFYPEIVEYSITNNTLKKAQKSSDRSGYIIYQSNKKMII